jgi:hypothetical protein
MFGAASSCPTTSGTEVELGSINTLSPGNGFTGGLSTGGCAATDESFGNFGVSGFTGVTTLPTTTNADGYTTPDPTSDASDVITNLKASLPSSGWSNSLSSSGNLTFLAQFGTPGGAPATDNSVNEVAVTISGITLDKAQAANDASIQVTVYICEDPGSLNGVSNTGSVSAFSGCNGSTGSQKPTGTLVSNSATLTNTTGSNQTGDTLTVLVPIAVAMDIAAIDVNIGLTSNNVGAASFSGVSVDFADPSPEPSTFVLMGSALAGLGIFAARRKKAQRAS